MSTLERGIIPVHTSGMGNQMFIISAGYVAHRHSGSPLYILKNSPSRNAHNKKGRDYNKIIFQHFGIHLPFTADTIGFLGYTKISKGGFEQWLPETIKPGTILSGYFQFYPALKPYEDDLRELFLRGLQTFRSPIPDREDLAFIHVRRGDYIDLKFHVLSADYYERAIHILRDKGIQNFVIISNDYPWVEKQEVFRQPNMKIFRSDDELETMAFMTTCKAGAICANSTFSWWGAFLGAYGLKNPVVFPKNWVYGTYVPDLFPQEWIYT